MTEFKIIDMPIILGPDLTAQEWEATLQNYREAKSAELETINASDERYADIERAARGLFWSDILARIQ